MEQSNNLPVLRGTAPEKITKQQIVALFNTETVRYNYHKMLQGLRAMVITKDNLKPEYPEFKEADKFIKAITDWRKAQAKPFNDVDALFLEVSKEIIEPISAELLSLKAQVKTASEANAAEIAQAKREQDRKDTIVRTMATFLNQVTHDILMSTTDKQIVLIQKRIGSEKSKKGFYAEYMDELEQKCAALDDTINSQKNKIRELDKLNESFEQALKANNDHAAAELKEKIEMTTTELTENSIRLQEQAFEQSMAISQVAVGQPDLNITKSKTTRWKWRVDDIEILRKKAPALTKIVPNDEAIEIFMKEQRDSGAFKTTETEFTVNGVTFYKEKYL